MTLKKTNFKLTQNITYKATDKQGRPKKLFQLTKLGQILMKSGIIHPNTNKALMQILGLGYWTYQMKISNLVVDAGKAGVASRIGGAGGEAAFTYIAIGTGTTTPAATDTALVSEVQRQAATVSRVTTNVTNDTARAETTFSFTATTTVTETGLFNAATGGTMLNRDLTASNTMNAGDNLQITIDIVVS